MNLTLNSYARSFIYQAFDQQMPRPPLYSGILFFGEEIPSTPVKGSVANKIGYEKDIGAEFSGRTHAANA